MKIKERIIREIKEALKSKNRLKINTLRMIKSAIDYKELEEVKPDESKEEELKKKELDDAEIIKVLKKLVKQRKESIESFRNVNREDAAKKEED